MALSRKNKRKLNRLRRDADRLWSEQQVVFEKARDLVGRAGTHAKDYADSEVAPVIRKSVDKNFRPAFERGVEGGRNAMSSVEEAIQHNVLPAVAQASGSVSGAVRHLFDSDQVKDQVKRVQKDAKRFNKDAAKNFDRFQKEVAKRTKKQKTGPGVGGWFLIGAGVAAVAAVGYALWQTFRADDDLWIADEELDAPVATVTTSDAK